MRFSASQVEQIAIKLLGEPNRPLSSKHELRFGSHGSLSVDLRKAAFFDHEADKGGGILDLIRREGHEAKEWLKDHDFRPEISGNGSARRGDGARDWYPVKAWPYHDENGVELFRVVRLENGEIKADGKPEKTYRQERPNGNGGYIGNVKGVRKVPYRLPQLIAAIAVGQTIYIPGGEKCCDALAGLGLTATCNPGGEGAKKCLDELAPHFTGADVVVLSDNDETGRKFGKLVASKLAGVAKRIRVLALPGLLQKGDIFEWLAAGGTREGLLQLVEAAPDYRSQVEKPEPTEIEDEVRRLAELSTLRYAIERGATAKRLKIPVGVLDKLVNHERKGSEPQGQGRPLDFPPPEPWLDPVNGAVLLDKIEAIIRRFIICSKHAATAMTLWVVATWFEEVAQVAPILNFKSPVHRCGKSTCLAIVGRLVKRRLLSSNTTPAALFRAIEKFQPTLVIDEADSFFGQNEELRGIINSGHTRESAFTLRTVGDELEPKTFSTWGFKAIAGIGRLAVTIEDRSITIELTRKTRAEKVDRLRHTNPQEFEDLSRQIATWASDHVGQMSEARPSIPEALNDRQQDNWDPLFSVASLAGEAWLKKAGEAALAICDVAEDASPQTQLLSDILAVFKSEGLIDDGGKIAEEIRRDGAGRPNELVGIPSQNLVTALVGMPDRPWSEINHGKQLTQNGLARKLKNFDIRPKNIRFGGTVLKGYAAADLVDSFVRYLDSPFPTATPLQTNDNNNLDDFPTATNFRQNSQALQTFPECIHEVKHICSDVAVGNPESHASDEEYEAELARISAMSDAERRAIEAAERAAEVKALGGEAAKSKALPSSKPGEPAAPLFGPAISPILGSTVEAAGSDDGEPKVWEEF
jgi:hypothetical protein